MKLKEIITYLKVITTKKINGILQSGKTAYITGSREKRYMVLERFSDLYLVERFGFDEILIVMNKSNMNKKAELIEIARYLTKKKKKIEIIEEEKVLNNKDIKYLASINDNIILNNVYIEHSKALASNENLKCKISIYHQIMEKITYLINICKNNFNTEEEQVVFIIVQLSDYVRYGNIEKSRRSCLENIFLMRVGVCIDMSIALWKVLTELGIECKKISGIANENNVTALTYRNHAWNQVKINDVWYNVEITWFNTQQKTNMLLVNDEQFETENAHAVRVFDNREICRKSFDRKKLEDMIKEFRKYKNVLREYDLGERKIVLKMNNE